MSALITIALIIVVFAALAMRRAPLWGLGGGYRGALYRRNCRNSRGRIRR